MQGKIYLEIRFYPSFVKYSGKSLSFHKSITPWWPLFRKTICCGGKVPLNNYKLDGVGPVDNTPSTNKLHHFVQKKLVKIKINNNNNNNKKIVTCDVWHVTCDMWHMTRDMWHVTHDTWHMTYLGGWTFSQKAKILYGPKEKVGFQVFVNFRFFMKPELVHQSLF